MEHIILTLPAMHCDGCVGAVTRVARRLGFTKVAADLATGRVVFDGGGDEPALRAALTKAGFPPG